jgi:hypothetical protein
VRPAAVNRSRTGERGSEHLNFCKWAGLPHPLFALSALPRAHPSACPLPVREEGTTFDPARACGWLACIRYPLPSRGEGRVRGERRESRDDRDKPYRLEEVQKLRCSQRGTGEQASGASQFLSASRNWCRTPDALKREQQTTHAELRTKSHYIAKR